MTAKFSARHYEAIASVLKSMDHTPAHFSVVAAFAGMLAKDNPKFNDSMFWFASGQEAHAARVPLVVDTAGESLVWVHWSRETAII